MVCTIFAQRYLAREFSLTIYIDWRSSIWLLPRHIPIARENVIGWVMNDSGTQRFCFFCNRFNTRLIKKERKLRLWLSLINSGICSCVNDETWLNAANSFSNALRITKVTTVVFRMDIYSNQITQWGWRTFKLPSHQPCFTEQQDVYYARSP